MKTAIIFLALSVAIAVAKPSQGIFEDEITKALQDYLADHDPASLAAIADFNITTDHSSILYSSTDNEFLGLSGVTCTEFSFSILSKHITMTLRFDNLDAHSPSYSMNGVFKGEDYSASGVGDLTIAGLQFTVIFKAETYSLAPVSLCVESGSFNLELVADTITANFVGADEINDDINANADNLLEQIEDQLNAQSAVIEAAINAALCQADY